jgi:8-oxo-dGTP pyrophosphatase MutT (NUDIX family)
VEYQDFIEKLKPALLKPMPGLEVQLRMSSLKRYRESRASSLPADAIKSAVLILLFPSENTGEPQMVLMLRSEYDGVHSGQIGLPGGKFKYSDLNLKRTALRESEEEIGVDSNEVSVIGRLTELYIPPSNFIVTPYVGFLEEKPRFSPDPGEVKEIIIIPVSGLIDKRSIRTNQFIIGKGIRIEAPCFDIDGHKIWGATAMILSEFREIVLEILRV